MNTETNSYKTIDEYIALFPPEIREKLQAIRTVVKECAPEAAEIISYQMPCFYLHGNLVYFAAFKKHIGFFPTASGIAHFEKELTDYKTSKGTVQFPLDKSLPLDLIRRMVEFKVEENMQKTLRNRKK